MYQKFSFSHFYELSIPGYQYNIVSYPGTLGWNFCHSGDPWTRVKNIITTLKCMIFTRIQTYCAFLLKKHVEKKSEGTSNFCKNCALSSFLARVMTALAHWSRMKPSRSKSPNKNFVKRNDFHAYLVLLILEHLFLAFSVIKIHFLYPLWDLESMQF